MRKEGPQAGMLYIPGRKVVKENEIWGWSGRLGLWFWHCRLCLCLRGSAGQRFSAQDSDESTLVLSLFFSSFLEVAFLISLSLILYPIETQHLFVFFGLQRVLIFPLLDIQGQTGEETEKLTE